MIDLLANPPSLRRSLQHFYLNNWVPTPPKLHTPNPKAKSPSFATQLVLASMADRQYWPIDIIVARELKIAMIKRPTTVVYSISS